MSFVCCKAPRWLLLGWLRRRVGFLVEGFSLDHASGDDSDRSSSPESYPLLATLGFGKRGISSQTSDDASSEDGEEADPQPAVYGRMAAATATATVEPASTTGILCLPDELLRSIGLALWIPVQAASVAPFACTCQRVAAALLVPLLLLLVRQLTPQDLGRVFGLRVGA